jgi:hypothetical protein
VWICNKVNKKNDKIKKSLKDGRETVLSRYESHRPHFFRLRVICIHCLKSNIHHLHIVKSCQKLVQIGNAHGKTICICAFNLCTDYCDGRNIQVYSQVDHAALFALMSGKLLCVLRPPCLDRIRLKQTIGPAKGENMQIA